MWLYELLCIFVLRGPNHVLTLVAVLVDVGLF
jgi:hypothetical protein